MKNFIFLLVLTLICGLAFGAAPQKLRVDQVQIGISGSAGAKDLSFDFGQGANNPKIQNDGTNFSFNQGSDFTGSVDVTGNFSVTGQTTKGDGNNATNLDTYDLGLGAANPYYGYDSTLGAMVFRNPGGPVKKMGSGSGGGEGGINILLNPNAEDGLVNWTNSGAGAFTEVYQSAEVLEGEKSFKFDSINIEDAVTSDLVTLNDGLIGTSCEARIYYKGGDENLAFELIDGNGTVLKTQAITPHPIASHESLFFLCPNATEIAGDANKGKLAVRVRQSTATNAIAITFDKMYLGSLIGLVETTLPDDFSFFVSAAGVVTGDDSSAIVGDCSVSSGTKNCTVTPGFLTVAAKCTATPTSSAGAYFVVVSQSGPTTIGVVTATTTTGAAVAAPAAVRCTKQGPDAKQTVQVYKSIPKIADNVNEFSASIGVSSSTVAANIPWIQACAGTSIKTCTFYPGIFSDAPICTTTVQQTSTVGTESRVTAVSSSSISVGTYSNGGSIDEAVNISCSKRGADFKTPTVQPVIVGQVTNSYAEAASKNVRVESCQINKSGTSTVDPNSSLCEHWINSVSSAGTGLTTVVFNTGVFSKPPVCQATIASNSPSSGTRVFNTSSTGISVYTLSAPGTGADYPVHITCHGAR